jgi:hypothetical protein
VIELKDALNLYLDLIALVYHSLSLEVKLFEVNVVLTQKSVEVTFLQQSGLKVLHYLQH